MNYLLHILIIISIYMILSSSLNILVGYTGLLSICHAAFYGIGAYVSVLLTTKLQVNFFAALAIAMLSASLLSLIVSTPSLRLKGDFFVLATLAFQIIGFDIFNNWTPLTEGPYGIAGIPSPKLLGLSFNSPAKYLLLSSAVASLCFLITRILLLSPFGLALKAVREDEIAAQALGKNVTKIKIKAFAIASGLAAVAGVLFAHYLSFIDPTSFTVEESIFILSIVLIGGPGNMKGPIVGTVLLIIIPEILRFLEIPNSVAPNVRQMIYGALLVIFMYFRPQGIAGVYVFE